MQRRMLTAKHLWALVSIAALLVISCGGGTVSPSGATTSPGATAAATEAPSFAKGTWVMKIASTDQPTGTPGGVTVTKFKELVEKNTNGAVEVQIFPAGQLGNPTASLASVQNGTVTASIGSSTGAEPILPFAGILSLPYLFSSMETFVGALEGDIGKRITTGLDAKGIVVLGWWTASARNIYGNLGPVTEPSQLRGKKIRVLTSPVFTSYFQALGVVPSNVAFAEVYLALSQGVIDGVETVFPPALALKHDEVAKDWILTEHVYNASLFGVNKIWFDGLPKSIQDILRKAMADLTPGEHILDKQMSDQANVDLKAKGKVVTVPNRAAFRAVARTVWGAYADPFGRDIINSILRAQGDPPLN